MIGDDGKLCGVIFGALLAVICTIAGGVCAELAMWWIASSLWVVAFCGAIVAIIYAAETPA